MVSSLDSAMSRPSSGVASPSHKPSSRSRTQSISSDKPSTIGNSFMSPPLSVSPEAAFIASSAASQIVTNDHDSHADSWYDQHGIEPSGEAAMVSPGALQLVNSFLDQLLFNFLCTSRSITLSSLRPAVSEVLKPKLAKDAINQADEELREYLGGDDEDLNQAPQAPSSPTDWDLELVWKRTRLRCMVYSSLGDMEEEDEDYHTEQEHLDTGLDRLSELVSPAVAIFLTSILEFMGEQALIVAGQAAYHRMRAKYEKELKEGARSPVDVADKIIVEELDMERVALDRTLGRLWRAWKKKIRTPGIGFMDNGLARSYSRDSMRGTYGHLRSPSTTAEPFVPATVQEPATEHDLGDGETGKDNVVCESIEEHLVEDHVDPVAVPLPLGAKDVEEIEVPGLVSYSDDESDEGEAEEESKPARPKSLMVLSTTRVYGPSTPTLSQPQIPVWSIRKRSNSLPTPAATPHDAPAKRQRTDQAAAEVNGALETASSASAGSDASDWVKAVESRTSILSPVSSNDATAEADEDEIDDADEIFIEEPRILTSSRVSISGLSISGRSSSPAISDHGKPGTIITSFSSRPVRSSSVHSARLIDVTGPRSPITTARGSPVDPSESIRQGSLSRNSSVRSVPIVEDRPLRLPETASVARLSGGYGTKSGLAASESISEAEESSQVDDEASPVSSAGAGLTLTPEPVSAANRYKQKRPGVQGPRLDLGPSTPTSPVKQTTKVTILSSAAASGTFFIDDRQDVPRRSPVQNRYQPTTPPIVPDRSPSRQALPVSPTQAQPSTIGLVSVERPRTNSPSEPSSAVVRSQHSSGSSPTTSTHKLKPVRTSEEGSHSRADVARNFEELIQSDQTIQYTLTPEGMRDIDSVSLSTRSLVSGSPILPVKARKSEDARQNGDRSRSSSIARPNELKRSGSVARSTVASVRPIIDQRNSNNSSSSSSGTTISKPSGAVPRSTNPTAPKSRSNAPQARDARMPRESLADFADFIRSTGPDGSVVAPPLRASGPSAVRNPTGPVPVSVSKSSIDSGRASTSRTNINRVRLQARDAAVDYKDDNSDLIDFIRRGPPSSAGNPRIPRAVAPFRTTMDSDQMSGAVGGKAVDAQLNDAEIRSSQASTTITDYSMPSAQSSINSQSALLGRNKPLPGSNSNGTMNTRQGAFDSDMPMPVRKTRRVRDPYAIDFSDEEQSDEDDVALKPKQRVQTQEESLIDFLNNVPPPPTPVTRPILQPQNQPKKKASAPSLMSRFTRRDSTRVAPPPSSSGVSSQSPREVPHSRGMSTRSSGSKGYIPLQVNMPPGVDKYAPGPGVSSRPAAPMGGMPSGKAAAMMGGMPPMNSVRVPMKKYQAREAVSVPSRETSDLADFFKNSEPPAEFAPTAQFVLPTSPSESSGFSRVFGRRRKASIA
ncbi:hypothetical protein B0T22DRAFT_382588 [Podospora appendiculata]|uniref:Uncharacterized protein n=1 Tax=Podospora appendiculata TaxID=314037 RepID=A0AAE0X770_9PEZI|nr:hypothetical protein B0T22DRAFT_382588 [Podospora appendiculata]